MLINWLESFYMRLPRFSTELQEYLVKFLPYIGLLFGLFFVVGSIGDIIGAQIGFIFSADKNTLFFIRDLLVLPILGIIMGILMFASVPSLNRRQLKGWKLLFYSQVVWIISSLVSLSPSLLIALILFYPFFQVKHYYK